MAKLYSIGLGLLAAVFAFGQGLAQFNATPTNIEEATPHFVKEESRIQLNPLSNSRSAQAAGDTIWSEDFSDTSGWEMNGFQIGTTNPNNLFGVPMLSSTGTSADNGFASYFEGDVVPEDEVYIKNSVAIDLSDFEAANLSFNSYYVHWWYNEMLVAVHNSAGYSDTTAVHTDIQPGYGSANPENIVINISKACGDAEVTIEFIFRTAPYGAYGWQFDDLAIIQALDKDLVVDDYNINMNGIGVYGGVPSSLVDSIVVFTEVSNNGAETLEGVKTKLSVFDGDDNLKTSFETTHDTLNLAKGDFSVVSASDKLYAESNAIYSLLVSASSSTGDQDQTNNVLSDAWSYGITDSSYERASYLYGPEGTAASWGDTTLRDDENSGAFQGATYFLYDSAEISSISMLLDSAGTSPDAKLVGKIYYVDGNLNRTEMYATDTFSIDTPLINFFGLTFQSITKSFNKGDKDGWLAPNKRAHEVADTMSPDHYIVGVELTNPVTTSSMAFISDRHPAHNYVFSSWVYVPGTNASWYYESSVPHIYLNVGEVREQDVVEDNDTTDTTDSTDTVDSSSSINDIFNTLEMYPNPAQDVLNITGFPNADVQVFNVIGALVMERRQVSDRVSLDVAALPKGNYIVKIVSDKGVATKKVVLGN